MNRLKALLRRIKERKVYATVLGLGIVILILPSVAGTLTNTITMAGKTTADYQALTVTPNTLKPKACDNINLTNVISGSGIVNGTAENDLILATDPNSTLNGNGGSDCLVIGDGLVGVLDGGGPPSGDTDVDICIGGLQTTYTRCETVQNNG